MGFLQLPKVLHSAIGTIYVGLAPSDFYLGLLKSDRSLQPQLACSVDRALPSLADVTKYFDIFTTLDAWFSDLSAHKLEMTLYRIFNLVV